MSAPGRLVTQRLILRRWRDDDIAPFAKLNADRHVMRFFSRTYGLEETKVRIAIWTTAFDERGYAPWAVEAPGIAACLGVVGASLIGEGVPLAGDIEILWRLDRPFWGKGYAVEAARAALRDMFERLCPAGIVAYTAAINTPSRRVMEKLGMAEDAPAAFGHPQLHANDPLRPHVVYRIARHDFLARDQAP